MDVEGHNGSGLHDLTDAAHGDWISDEILLLEDGSSGTAWRIVSEDVVYRRLHKAGIEARLLEGGL